MITAPTTHDSQSSTVVPHSKESYYKMKRLIIGIGFITLLFYGCDSKITALFEIENKTGFRIDSLRIVPNGYESDNFIFLNQGEKKEYLVDMSAIIKTDGDYKISFKPKEDSVITKVFGYYTNGYPLEKITRIIILSDTILINQEFN
jgi:hypothetical protein